MLLMMVALPLSILAQDFSWIENSPEKYQPAMTQKVVSAASTCNKGDEAFKDFIPRFRTDKQFRAARLRFEDDMHAHMFNLLADWNNGKGYALIKAFRWNTRCDKSFGTWYNVAADEVCFAYIGVLLCGDAGGSSFHLRFQRINGKWYCTAMMMAG